MESLALVVSILVLICFFSGPLGLLLTSRFLTSASTHPAAFVFRRTAVVINGLLGLLVSTIFFTEPIPALLKFISLASLIFNTWVLDREFGSHLATRIRANLAKGDGGNIDA